MRFLLLLLTIGLMACGTLFAQEAGAMPPPPGDAPFWLKLVAKLIGSIPEVNLWLAAVIALGMGICRALGEFLAWLAPRTDTDVDDKLKGCLSWVLLWLSAIVGWFGLGSPRQLAKKKADD